MSEVTFPEAKAALRGMDKADIKKLFTAMTWVPTAPQVETIEGLRKACYQLAGTIAVNTQPGAEQTIAIRRVWEAFEYAKLAVMLGVEVF